MFGSCVDGIANTTCILHGCRINRWMRSFHRALCRETRESALFHAVPDQIDVSENSARQKGDRRGCGADHFERLDLAVCPTLAGLRLYFQGALTAIVPIVPIEMSNGVSSN
jgi:hypothetical protein